MTSENKGTKKGRGKEKNVFQCNLFITYLTLKAPGSSPSLRSEAVNNRQSQCQFKIETERKVVAF